MLSTIQGYNRLASPDVSEPVTVRVMVDAFDPEDQHARPIRFQREGDDEVHDWTIYHDMTYEGFRAFVAKVLHLPHKNWIRALYHGKELRGDYDIRKI